MAVLATSFVRDGSVRRRMPTPGTVKLTIRGETIPEWLSSHHRSAGTRHLISDAERARSEQPVVNGSEQVTAWPIPPSPSREVTS